MSLPRSELLALLNSRKAWELPPYVVPHYNRKDRRLIAQSVACMAALDNSDPYVGPRVALYLARGYCLPSEVHKDCKSRTALRATEPRTWIGENELVRVGVELEKKRKKEEIDKAWNQANSARFLEEQHTPVHAPQYRSKSAEKRRKVA
jgi:hypothetical protein